jgi:TetR/AcrR family transcriptional regulator, mexCD-oprJ operon repressor
MMRQGPGVGEQRWLITTAYSLMHAAAEDVTAGRLDADDAAGFVTATLLAAFTPQVGE